MKKIKSWENNYKEKRRYNIYPFNEIVSNVLKYKSKEKNQKSLDLGCGGGAHVRFLEQEGYKVYAVDSSPSALKLSKLLVKNKSKAKFILSNFINLPFKNNFFNLVIDRASITHNKINDIKKIFTNIFNQLKNNGIYIGTFWSDKCSEKKFGKKILNVKYAYKFNKGNFKYSPIVTFLNKNILRKIMNRFIILDMYLIRQIHKKFMIEQIIVVAQKKV